jgi:chromosome partitioning protein
MSIITLTQFKGGVGKTTCAICLADLLHEVGDTLLIDSDPNRSASLWARKGTLPFTVCTDTEAPKLLTKGTYRNVVIDTPARPAQDEIVSLAKGCDLLILPSNPEPLSLNALAQIVSTLPEGTEYRALVTLSPPSPQKDGIEAIAALQRAGIQTFSKPIRRLKAYVRASDMGVALRAAPGGRMAWNDWQSVWGELKDVIA